MRPQRRAFQHAWLRSCVVSTLLCAGHVWAQSAPAPAAIPEPAPPVDAAVPAEPAPPAPVAEPQAVPPPPAPEPQAPPPPAFDQPATAAGAAAVPAPEPTYTYDASAVPPPPPPEPKEPNPFARGTFKLSVMLGVGYSSSGDNYLILGAGPGYYLIDGLVLDFTAEAWFIADPTLGKLTPGLTYVLHFVPVLKPYVGVFYRYTMIEDPYSNVSSLGVRFGAYLVSSARIVIGLGAVYEHYLDSLWDPWWYPELSIGIVF